MNPRRILFGIAALIFIAGLAIGLSVGRSLAIIDITDKVAERLDRLAVRVAGIDPVSVCDLIPDCAEAHARDLDCDGRISDGELTIMFTDSVGSAP